MTQSKNLQEDLKFRSKVIKFFADRNNRKKTNYEINYRGCYLLLKKTLIYLIILIQLMNDYVDHKTNSKPSNHNISYMIDLVNKAEKNSINSKQNSVKVKKSLLKMDLEELMNQVKIEDIQKYITLIHTNIYPDQEQVQVKLKVGNEQKSFIMTKKEQRLILNARIQFKENQIQLSFKFIRTELLKAFKKKNKRRFSTLNQFELKEKFNEIILDENKKSIEIFNAVNLCRNLIDVLKRNTQIQELMNDFLENHYIQCMVNEYILKGSEFISREDLSIQEFLTEALSRQLHHRIVYQSVLNSMEHYMLYLRHNIKKKPKETNK